MTVDQALLLLNKEPDLLTALLLDTSAMRELEAVLNRKLRLPKVGSFVYDLAGYDYIKRVVTGVHADFSITVTDIGGSHKERLYIWHDSLPPIIPNKLKKEE